MNATRSRRRLHLGEPCHGAGERHAGSEGGDGLFAAQGDPAEAFDAVEEALNEMALLVERPVDRLASCAARVLLDLRPGAEFVGSGAAQRIGGRQAASATAWPTPSSPAIGGWACGQSPQRPGVISNRTGRPSASTTAWILVVRPPRERPIARASSPPFARSRRHGPCRWWHRPGRIRGRGPGPKP